MTVSQKILGAGLGILVAGGVYVSAQNKVPGPDLAGIAENKARHAEIVLAIQANTRVLIVIARLASQDSRVAAANTQAADVQRQLTDIRKERAALQADIRELRRSLTGQSGAQRAEISKEIDDKRAEEDELRKQEQTVAAQLTEVQKALKSEQTLQRKVRAQLDELEKSLPGR